VGARAAGRSWPEVFRLAEAGDIDLLVPDADWFGPVHTEALEVAPGQMRGRLSELRSQRWRGPLRFPDRRGPWPGTINRRLWIECDGIPLLEQVGPLAADRRIVLSYVPWARQLGRNDLADDLLEYVIRSVADPERPEMTLRPLRVIGAVRRAEDADSAVDTDVLDAAARSLDLHVAQADALRVIDLRGAERPSTVLLKAMAKEGARGDEEHPLLILGDDRALNECMWLELDRRKATVVKPAGACWLPGDNLPPLQTDRIRAMIALTDFGVPIKNPSEEKPS